MKLIKIIVLTFILALVVFLTYKYIESRNVPLTPIPEDTVKVIQISPK